MGKRVLIFVSIWAMLPMFASCDSDTYFREEASLPEEGWMYDHPVHFEYDITDTAQVMNMLLDVYHSEEYAWQNLYVKLLTFFPGGRRDTQILSLELADKQGNWLGASQGISGHIKAPILLQSSFKFQIPGTYTLDVTPDMRVNPVQEVRKLGLRLERVHPPR